MDVGTQPKYLHYLLITQRLGRTSVPVIFIQSKLPLVHIVCLHCVPLFVSESKSHFHTSLDILTYNIWVPNTSYMLYMYDSYPFFYITIGPCKYRFLSPHDDTIVAVIVQ